MAFGVVTTESRPHELGSISDAYTVRVATKDVIDSRVDVGAAQNHLSQLFTVSTGDSNWDSQFFGRLNWDADIIDAKIRIRADDGSCTEVHTLPRQVASETAFLSFESLRKRLQRAARTMPSRRDACRLVVEIRGNVIL